MLKAVVFDVDGTLLDTRELIRLGYVETLRAHGFTKEAEAFEIGTLSKPIKECYRQMVGEKLSEELLADMLKYHEDLQNKSVSSIMAYEGLEDILAALERRKLMVGIFTSGSLWHVQRNFKHVGVAPDEVFDAIVTSDDHTSRKPAPDGILLCLKRLGDVRPDQIVMVGDHAADIQAGRAAGARATIGLLHGLGTRKELQEASADYLIPSLGELLATLDIIEHDD
ncbi:MAG TPA: HAD family hydrolase [Candidatus Saccharimonadales bacterium]|nr:HAD family hydrolase [Candidatus Saccharimonadales bacterium]